MRSRFVPLGFAVAALALTAGCTGSSNDTTGGDTTPTPASSSPTGIGKQTQITVDVAKSQVHDLLPAIRHLDGVDFASFEPDDGQIRVFFKATITTAERAQLVRKIRNLAG